jgi:hypothetical protein
MATAQVRRPPEDTAHPGQLRQEPTSRGGVAEDAFWPLDMRQEASAMVRFPRSHPS